MLSRSKIMSKNWIPEKNPNEWMRGAISNLELTKTAPESEKIRYEDRCYLCSRSVEYSIKTLMILKLGKYRTGHDLKILIDELEAEGITLPEEIKNAAIGEYCYGRPMFEKGFFNLPWSPSPTIITYREYNEYPVSG